MLILNYVGICVKIVFGVGDLLGNFWLFVIIFDIIFLFFNFYKYLVLCFVIFKMFLILLIVFIVE